jgi:gluconokinase
MRVVVMGISGVGKTTIGSLLADRLGVPFQDADDLHPPANRAKMTAGSPLDDRDREPWLEIVGRYLAGNPAGAVVACSALRRRYRDTLRRFDPGVTFVHLAAETGLIEERMRQRTGHFMPASLLASQTATLEPLEEDEHGLVVDARLPPETILARIAAASDAAGARPA